MEIKTENINTFAYQQRCKLRENKISDSTMNFVDYFISLGDDKNAAETKVSEISTEVAAYLYVYVLGNKTPLINAINNSALPFMDAAAKDFLIKELTNQ